jgi:hypothetical protein
MRLSPTKLTTRFSVRFISPIKIWLVPELVSDNTWASFTDKAARKSEISEEKDRYLHESARQPEHK